MRVRRMILALVATVAVGEIAPVIQYAAAAQTGVTAQQVQASKSAADHQALAAGYEAEAEAAKNKAVEHRKMAQAYKGMPAVSGGKVTAASAMPDHCERLARNFDQQAEMYTAMATTERELAKAAK